MPRSKAWRNDFARFRRRALAWAKDLRQGRQVSRHVERDKRLIVGTVTGKEGRAAVDKKHRRLALKAKGFDLGLAIAMQNKVAKYLDIEKITPKHYKFEKFQAFHPENVQEYFNSPTLNELKAFLNAGKQMSKPKSPKKWREQGGLTKDQYFVCKRFMSQPQNRGITLASLEEAKNEMERHFRGGGWILPIDENIIVRGRLKSGKIRATVIDV